MYISDNYFCEEEREGFVVSSKMKSYWASQLEVLQVIDEVCHKLGVRYFADWGTLLGAIRHKGFIPWDDDIDICMLRKDYWRFIRNVQKELPTGYLVLSPFENYQQELGARVSRIINNQQVCIDEQFLKKFHGCPYVTGVDIFPIDNIPDNIEEEKLQKKMICIVDRAITLLRSNEVTEEYKSSLLSQVEEICNVHLVRNVGIEEQLSTLLDSLCGMYAQEDTEYVRVVQDWLSEKERAGIPADAYQGVDYFAFEMIKIPVPVDYKTVIEYLYGKNYMEPIRNAGK